MDTVMAPQRHLSRGGISATRVCTVRKEYRPMTPERGLALRLGFILLAGCPQLLDDDFVRQSHDAGGVLAESDAGDEANVGGNGGAGASGGASGAAGTSGAPNAGGSDVGGASAADSGVGPPDAGGTAPTVLSVTPADGARGVLPDAELVFTFSTAMNTNSVETAYASSELPSSAVTFTWSAGDTILTVRPSTPLVVATGSDPALVAAASYAVDVTSEARDKAGNALVAEHVGFTTVRSITQQLNAEQNRDLTGNWRTDGTYGINYCERVDTTICMGDGSATYKAFVTFELGSVPGDLVSLASAELSSTVLDLFGAPFSALGALQIEHAEFTSIGDEAFAAPPLSAPRTLSTGAAAGDPLSADVLADVGADFGVRARSQFRLYFAVDTNSDGVADQVVCDWSSVHLTLSYFAP
jgi:hypothetical protein